jgi:hypothetical protein
MYVAGPLLSAVIVAGFALCCQDATTSGRICPCARSSVHGATAFRISVTIAVLRR